jgi:zinc-ribbon domain
VPHFYLVMAVAFGIVSAVAAHGKGRNSLGWFLAGLVIGPFALFVTALPNVPCPGQFIACTDCGEVIREDAKLCRYCGLELRENRPMQWLGSVRS